MIQAAISGQGVALGRLPLVNDLIQSGALATPFRKAMVGSRGYFIIESEHGAAKPHVRAFAAWLMEEAKRST
jgi:LysR family glycine cleavage system transcriptional activator